MAWLHHGATLLYPSRSNIGGASKAGSGACSSSSDAFSSSDRHTVLLYHSSRHAPLLTVVVARSPTTPLDDGGRWADAAVGDWIYRRVSGSGSGWSAGSHKAMPRSSEEEGCPDLADATMAVGSIGPGSGLD